jgi:hypothetical protein
MVMLMIKIAANIIMMHIIFESHKYFIESLPEVCKLYYYFIL